MSACFPSQTVPAELPAAFSYRGVSPQITTQWPNALLGTEQVYGVDFSSELCCDEIITKMAVQITGATLGWDGAPTHTLSGVYFCAVWNAVGTQTIVTTAITSSGRSLSMTATVQVLPQNALLTPDNSVFTVPPNVLMESNTVPLLGDNGTPLFVQ